jgi:DNA polymerase III epsilon subunit family exonuclease
MNAAEGFDQLLDQPIRQAEFVVVDVETTGLNPKDDRLTEIAMFTVRDMALQDEFSTLINPLVSIPASITRMTGIDNVMVANAPTAREVVPTIAEILTNRIFVAHNAPFDWGFVYHSALRERGLQLDNPQLCTVRLSRKLIPWLASKSLGPVAHHLHIKIPERHRASGDAYATSLILIHYLKQLEEEHDMRTVRELLKFQGYR